MPEIEKDKKLYIIALADNIVDIVVTNEDRGTLLPYRCHR